MKGNLQLQKVSWKNLLKQKMAATDMNLTGQKMGINVKERMSLT
jgi:hypothetical protein